MDETVFDCNDPCSNLEEVTIGVVGEFCSGQVLELSAQSDATLTNIVWQASNGQSGNGLVFEVIFDAPGVYFVSLTANDAQGCTYEADIGFDIDVCETPCDNLADVSIRLAGEACTDSMVFFSLNTVATLYSFEWTFSNGETLQDESFFISFDQPGIYSVEFNGTDADGCLYEALLSFAIQDCTVDCTGEIGINLNGEICQSTTGILSVESDESLVEYLWQIEGQESITNPTVTINLSIEGIYFVNVQVIAANNCIYSDELSIIVDNCEPIEACNLVLPNAFTPNGDGINDDFRANYDCPPIEFQLQIFNRWGGIVFETNDVDQGWNGEQNGRIIMPGTYIWM